MSREIKFRAWNGVDYVLTDEIKFQDIKPMQEKGFVFEQFTGLKDMNGREIYEGDVVKSIDDNHDYATFEYFNEVVSFVDGSFLPVSERLYEYFEVIGNIHENPELKP